MAIRKKGQVTERTYYPAFIDVIRGKGGKGVSEVSYNSEPDIVFDYEGFKWLLSVKIGETPGILKSAFIQYQRHKDESNLDHGLLVFLPESARKVQAEQLAVEQALSRLPISCIVDTPLLKEEYGDVPFPLVVDRISNEVMPRLARKEEKPYSLDLIVKFLQEQVTELMAEIPPEDPSILTAITDRNLLSGIGRLDRKHAKVATQFLGASILLSQILFLRLYGTAHPGFLPAKPITRTKLRAAFRHIWDINYRPIYDFDVLGTVSEEYLRATFDLITGLEIERSRYELPGRLFHALMPEKIRKLMAAFYTRPPAADVLSNLAIEQSAATVLDPACGSGTILVASYRRKDDLRPKTERLISPHKTFCEHQIYGADIMPFAVHLTTANLAAMDPSTTIQRTQIVHGDSLKLVVGRSAHGLQKRLFPSVAKGNTMKGTEYQVDLKRVDVVLMNPPFTKIERGIQQFVDMRRFRDLVGSEVGLWGHFIPLAYEFLKDDGIMGAVLPVSIMRGRETQKIRNFLFSSMTPLYILKATLNYGFSESSEYRDVLFVAKKGTRLPNQRVRFCLLKFDINGITWERAREIAEMVRQLDRNRGQDIDIETFGLDELRQTQLNLMPFLGVTDYAHRDILIRFRHRFGHVFRKFPTGYIKEGLRSAGETSSVMFFTRNVHPSRLEAAFLGFKAEDASHIVTSSQKGLEYVIEKNALRPTLRTPVGLNTLDVTMNLDFIAFRPYEAFPRVLRAAGVRAPSAGWSSFFRQTERELNTKETNLVLARRINPFSPNIHFLAFMAGQKFSPGDQLKLVVENDVTRAKATCVILNSAIFLADLFLFKEETTGRFIDIRSYDIEEVELYPVKEVIQQLGGVFDTFSLREFPALRDQLDQNFIENYERFWARRSWDDPTIRIDPSPRRMEFDRAIFEALNVAVSEQEQQDVYKALAKEMIITRGLTRD